MLVSEFDYELPAELIAQEPVEPRDSSRLLVLNRAGERVEDRCFSDISEYLRAGDLLVLNDTRVIPARVFGRLPTGGKLELLLLRHLSNGTWEALTRPARKARPGTEVCFGRTRARILERKPEGLRTVCFEPADVAGLMQEQGELALPPYIRKKCDKPERYQTVYATRPGAVAAPTAGLHFTPELLARIRSKGVELASLTLHAGLGTFRPVAVEHVESHQMHAEEYELTEETTGQVNRALTDGRRVVCAGTTTARVLEDRAARCGTGVEAGRGQTSLYIYPGHEWRVCGALLTNFHLPRSTLLMLVAAFAGRDFVMRAYDHAIAGRYRFCSFGDAMLVV